MDLRIVEICAEIWSEVSARKIVMASRKWGLETDRVEIDAVLQTLSLHLVYFREEALWSAVETATVSTSTSERMVRMLRTNMIKF